VDPSCTLVLPMLSSNLKEVLPDVIKLYSYMSVRAGAMLTEIFLKNFDGIPSGPDASCGSNYCNS